MRKHLVPIFAAGILMSTTGVAQAASSSLDQILSLGQTSFDAISEDLGATISYKPVVPAEPLGLLGFDVGLEISATKIGNSAAMKEAVSGTALTTIPTVKLHAHKGLPFGIDVGLVQGQIPLTGIEFTGAELRYSIFSGGIIMPAVAIRGAMTKTTGLGDMDLSTSTLDVSVSKGFLMLTGYAGLGIVNVESKMLSGPKFSYSDTLNKSYAGLNLNLGLLNFAGEIDATGESSTTTIKMGFRF